MQLESIADGLQLAIGRRLGGGRDGGGKGAGLSGGQLSGGADGRGESLALWLVVRAVARQSALGQRAIVAAILTMGGRVTWQSALGQSATGAAVSTVGGRIAIGAAATGRVMGALIAALLTVRARRMSSFRPGIMAERSST